MCMALNCCLSNSSLNHKLLIGTDPLFSLCRSPGRLSLKPGPQGCHPLRSQGWAPDLLFLLPSYTRGRVAGRTRGCPDGSPVSPCYTGHGTVSESPLSAELFRTLFCPEPVLPSFEAPVSKCGLEIIVITYFHFHCLFPRSYSEKRTFTCHFIYNSDFKESGCYH